MKNPTQAINRDKYSLCKYLNSMLQLHMKYKQLSRHPKPVGLAHLHHSCLWVLSIQITSPPIPQAESQ